MKHSIIVFLTLTVFFWGFGQESPKALSKEYRFENEYQYRSVDGETTSVITIQYTGEKFLKVTLNKAGEFLLLDAEDRFVANNFGGKMEVKPFSGRPALSGNREVKLEPKGETHYQGYLCDVYHITLGNDVMKFYFEKKESGNFNRLLAKVLAFRGVTLDESTLPEGKLIAGMEVKNGKDIDVIALTSVKEDQNITFTLKATQ